MIENFKSRFEIARLQRQEPALAAYHTKLKEAEVNHAPANRSTLPPITD